MKTPLTKDRIRHHLAYSWWMYAILAICTVLFWNILFTVTAYRVPEDKKVDIYIYGYGSEEAFDAYLTGVREAEMSDMEEMRAIFSVPDETYGSMVLMAHIAAGEGDIYILDKAYYQNYASDGAFLPLEDLPEIAAMEETHRTALERAWRKSSEYGRHLFGLPLSCVPGISQFVTCSPSDYYLCVAANNQNDENTFKLLQIMLRDLSAPAQAE